MTQTDRQTDKSARSACWEATAFDAEDIARLQDKENLPDFVKEVWGGLEKCPETGRIHFQGAVFCFQQQRFSALKKWLPGAHLATARCAEALKKYCMKEETAVGEKTVIKNVFVPLRCKDLMLMIAREYEYDREGPDVTSEMLFWGAINNILLKNPDYAGQLQNPANKSFFIHTRMTWRQLAAQAPAHPIVLQGEPPSVPPEGAADGEENNSET